MDIILHRQFLITEEIKLYIFCEWTDWLKQKFTTIPEILKQHYFEFNSLDKRKVKISTSSNGEKTTILYKLKKLDKKINLIN